MRQVPKYLIIGNGRMAKHMAHYLTMLGIDFMQWDRNSHTLLKTIAKTATTILVLINDSAIDNFIEKHRFLLAKTVVHFSGALSSKIAFSAHPLMTFSNELYTLEKYRAIPFVIEKNNKSFAELLPGLKNNHYKIAAELKPYYHAVCVIANNFTTILWQKFFTELEKRLNIPHEAALPLLEQTLLNLKNNPAGALTGPLARNDKITIEKNLAALEGDKFQAIYRAFMDLYDNSNKA